MTQQDEMVARITDKSQGAEVHARWTRVIRTDGALLVAFLVAMAILIANQ